MLANKEIPLRIALIMLVLAYGIKGRKKLQKILYLTNCSGWNIIHDYRFYLYGPYSGYVFSTVNNLAEEELVKVNEEGNQNNNSKYYHRFTDKGRSLLATLIDEVESPELIHRTEELVSKLNEYSSEQLEVMASLYYLHLEYPSSSKEGLISKLRNLKPHIGRYQLRSAFLIFNIMNRYRY